MGSEVVVWGLGDQFRVIAPLLRDLGHKVVAGIDDTQAARNEWSSKFGVGSHLDDLLDLTIESDRTSLGFLVCIGNPFGRTRVRVAQRLASLGMEEISVISPGARVVTSRPLRQGVQILPGAIVQVEASLGRQVIVNTGAIVEHDCTLGVGSEVGPGATLCGRVEVGDFAWVGAGATVLPRLVIGQEAIVGAGACVTRDVPDGAVVVGNPARQMDTERWAWEVRMERDARRLRAQLEP